jgi:hypothetical protein
MKFDLVQIFAAFFCFAVAAKSENAFQSRREGSLASERDLMRMGELQEVFPNITTAFKHILFSMNHAVYDNTDVFYIYYT